MEQQEVAEYTSWMHAQAVPAALGSTAKA